MTQMTKPPKIIREAEVPTFGPGYDEEHYISVPIKQFFSLKNIGNVGVCMMEPGDETVVFAIEAVDDGTKQNHKIVTFCLHQSFNSKGVGVKN